MSEQPPYRAGPANSAMAMAIAGLVLGYLQFAVGLLLMAFVVFLILGVTLWHWHRAATP